MASRKTVLVIDDDADLRFVFGAILNGDDGYDVIAAADGAEGVALATRHLPDVIVMDILMPVMNGLDAAAALSEDERTRKIPIVAVTGERESLQSQPELAAALFHSWLAKPIKPTRLREHIRSVIGDP